jgi:hypothetical protein
MTAELKSFLPSDLGQLMGNRKSSVFGQLDNLNSNDKSDKKLPIKAPTDYKSLMNILDTFPDQIQGIWKERLSGMSPDSVATDPAILNGFVHDHPNLFQSPPRWNPPETPKE